MNRPKFQQALQLLIVPIKVLASKAFLLWMIIAWISYYSISSIWMEEAFGYFINQLRNNLIIQIPFLLFLAGAIMNLARASKNNFQQSKRKD